MKPEIKNICTYFVKNGLTQKQCVDELVRIFDIEPSSAYIYYREVVSTEVSDDTNDTNMSNVHIKGIDFHYDLKYHDSVVKETIRDVYVLKKKFKTPLAIQLALANMHSAFLILHGDQMKNAMITKLLDTNMDIKDVRKKFLEKYPNDEIFFEEYMVDFSI